MGYSTRTGTRIRDFWPDDDTNTIYITSDSSPSLADIIEQARDKWGADVSLDDIEITSEKIHTHCLGYDLYDPSDYTDFIIITKKSN